MKLPKLLGTNCRHLTSSRFLDLRPTEMKFNIAAVSFLNAVPLIDWFLTEQGSGHQLLSDLPSRMSVILESGAADVALLPVVETFRGKSGGIVKGAGIGCIGNVDSVKLFSNGRLSQIKKVFTDRGSKSSVALVQVLLRELEGIKPELQSIEPIVGQSLAENEAILVIGDRCFEYENHLLESGDENVFIYDLGGLWGELTGLPFVFAVWALAPGFEAKWGQGGVNQIANLLAIARDFGINNLDAIASREAKKGRLGYLGKSTPEAISHYFQQSLVYSLGDQEFAGIQKFHELCVKYELVSDPVMPRTY